MDQPARPSKTLAEIHEATVANRRNIAAARHHVGAAGLEQTAALEGMISVGRGQKTVTQALESLGYALRNEHADDTEAQKKTMAELQVVSDEQLALAHELDELIALTLHNVTVTPLEQISVMVLNEIGDEVKEQIATLEALIERAQDGSSPRQKGLYQRAEDEAQAATVHLDAADAAKAGGEVHSLSATGEETIMQITEVNGASPETQINALERMSEKAQEQADIIRNQQELL